MRLLRQGEGGSCTLKIAGNGLDCAAGPYKRDHPSYLSCWWEWVLGSTPLSWHCTAYYSSKVHDGQPHFLIGDFGTCLHPQRPCKIEHDMELVQNKVVPVRLHNNIKTEPVDSLIHNFNVSKGL